MTTHAIALALSVSLALSCSSGTSQQRSVRTATQADTSRPTVPTELNLPQVAVLTVAPPDDPTVLYYRNIVGIAFVDSASGPTVRAVLEKYNAVIIGGDSNGPWGEYIVSVPDPGTTFSALESLIAQIGAEPAVAEASWIAWRDKIEPRGP